MLCFVLFALVEEVLPVHDFRQLVDSLLFEQLFCGQQLLGLGKLSLGLLNLASGVKATAVVQLVLEIINVVLNNEYILINQFNHVRGPRKVQPSWVYCISTSVKTQAFAVR